ncbi:MAG: hypothetical protein GXO77_02910 [Calditrichaeota bacterium]|nr:hypothetical protein [Calditrichota bacterium]
MASSKMLMLIIFFLILNSNLFSQDKVDRLKFSHKLHVVEQEVECQACHGSAEKSETGKDDLLPSMETCADCHDVEDEENCSKCHTDVENIQLRPRIESYNQKFSHKLHLGKGLDCKSCHQSVTQESVPLSQVLPTMVQCMDCHKQKAVSTECSACHLPGEQLKPASHTLDFSRAHSILARIGTDIKGQKNCTTCHNVNFCQDCHEGDNLTRKTHPLNYEFTHSFAAIGKEKQCLSCHEDRTFCADCHSENNVMPYTHTAGWAVPEVGGRHKEEAAADFEYCMTCHEQNADEICSKCHTK